MTKAEVVSQDGFASLVSRSAPVDQDRNSEGFGASAPWYGVAGSSIRFPNPPGRGIGRVADAWAGADSPRESDGSKEVSCQFMLSVENSWYIKIGLEGLSPSFRRSCAAIPL